jgi:3-oxoacyl-[acyl-carrier-protein] synthase-3
MTIRIEAAAYRLGTGEAAVEDWCRAQSMPPGHAAALADNGARRYRYAQGERLEALAGTAIEQLLHETAVPPSAIDALIVYNTSQCSVLPMPHTLAGRLRSRLSLSRATAFSIAQQQCVSPVHALRVLDALFTRHPAWRHAIVAGADKILREDLRAIGTSGIHSDAGGAMLIGRAGDEKVHGGIHWGIHSGIHGGIHGAVRGLYTYNDPKAVMGFLPDGRYEPNNNYLWSLISGLRRIAKLAGVPLAEIASVIPHNVNRPAWLQALDALRIPRERLFAANFATKGHAFGSDIAMNIADSGVLARAGSHLVLVSGIGGCIGGFILTAGAQA